MNRAHGQHPSEPTFEWYALVPSSGPLEQGDLIDNFPLLIPPPSLAAIREPAADQSVEVESRFEKYNVIVITQSCDLVDLRDEDQVILCPRYDLNTATTRSGKSLGNKDGWNKLTRGFIIGAHLISRCDLNGHEFDYQVIDLQRVFTAPLSLVSQVAAAQGDRVRLLPPYREHLSQAFTRQFMRVGLPIPLPARFPYA